MKNRNLCTAVQCKTVFNFSPTAPALPASVPPHHQASSSHYDRRASRRHGDADRQPMTRSPTPSSSSLVTQEAFKTSSPSAASLRKSDAEQRGGGGWREGEGGGGGVGCHERTSPLSRNAVVQPRCDFYFFAPPGPIVLCLVAAARCRLASFLYTPRAVSSLRDPLVYKR